MKWAEKEENEIGDENLELWFQGGEGQHVSVVLYNRLIHHLTRPALTIHQSVIGENGFEVWRRLNQV
jgi:hypothetical protein